LNSGIDTGGHFQIRYLNDLILTSSFFGKQKSRACTRRILTGDVYFDIFKMSSPESQYIAQEPGPTAFPHSLKWLLPID